MFKGIAICFFALIVSCNIGCGQKNNTPLLENHPTAIAGKTGRTSIGKKLRENNHLPIEERIALYHRLKKESPETYTFGYEDDLTMYGYSLLWAGKTEEALAVFQLIVTEYPTSSNPYDSVGEAYLKLGDRDKSLASYRKAVEIDPNNLNALGQIERILDADDPAGQSPTSPTGQPTAVPTELFAKVFTAQGYKADLDELGKKLTEIHPNALKFTSKDDFWKVVEKKKALVTDRTTYAEFVWHCNEIIASIGCSHTTGGFYHEWEILPAALRFPFETRWVKGQLYVVDDRGNKGKVAVKDEILSINGVAVAELMDDIYRHIPAQAHIKNYKRHIFNAWSLAMIPYALNFPESYELSVKGKKEPIRLNPAPAPAQGERFEEPFQLPCPDNLCLEILEADNTAILTVSSFNYYWWSNLTVFTDFMDKSFKKINEKGIKNLIIDVRFNGGGSSHSSIHLLKYLVDKPFVYYSQVAYDEEEGVQVPFENRYKGKLYFLMDGHGNSTTGHFMSIVKTLKLGTIVGEELGSNQFCTAGQVTCKLPNTGFLYFVANMTCISSATSLPDDMGILPDHNVTQSIENYLENVDTVKRYALGLIRGVK